ncbi:MAG: response regulator [Mariprofundaceae bacterium]
MKVLLVEDDLIGQKVAFKVLSRSGMDVTVVSNGQQALQKLTQGQFDVMLTDLRMPEMDGLTLVKKVRGMEVESGTRLLIVGLSAHALQPVIDEALASGMDDFLIKPVDPYAIFKSVSSV